MIAASISIFEHDHSGFHRVQRGAALHEDLPTRQRRFFAAGHSRRQTVIFDRPGAAMNDN